MRNIDYWRPTKYVYQKNKLRATKSPDDLNIGSRLISELIARLYDRYLPHYAAGKLIDLGCGKVPFYQTYKNHIIDNICVDLNRSSWQNVYIDCECDLNRPLPFRKEEFNTVILSDVLEHVSQPDRLWQEIARIIKPEGNVILNVPFFYWLHEKPHDYFRYTKYALKRFASENGFQVVELITMGGSPEIFTDFIAKHLQKLPVVGKFLALVIQYFTLGIISTKIGEKISMATAEFFPLGYFMIAQKNPHKEIIVI